MRTYIKGETVICLATVKDSEGTLSDPSTSFEITIINPEGIEVIADVAMLKDSTGEYHYDYNSSLSNSVGTYTAVYTATDGTRVSIAKHEFKVDAV